VALPNQILFIFCKNVTDVADVQDAQEYHSIYFFLHKIVLFLL